MSLGLPDFTPRGARASGESVPRVVRIAGWAVVAVVSVLGLVEWRGAALERGENEKARADVRQASRAADDARLALRRNSDLLVAAASVESSPRRVLDDLTATLPKGVSVTGLRVEYTPEAVARVSIDVVAQTPQAYDRFLSALSQAPAFADIQPGSETRPGFVRATLIAVHRPGLAGGSR